MQSVFLFIISLFLSLFKCLQNSLNDLVNYNVYECLFQKEVAVSLIQQYDIVLDCTDNVITRYLINDTCVLLNKTLVSGSALKFDGQVFQIQFYVK